MRFVAVLIALLAAVACQGRPSTQFPVTCDVNGLPKMLSSLEEARAGVGKLCGSTDDCASGLVCTDMMASRGTQCALPWNALTGCPAGWIIDYSATATTGQTGYSYTGYAWCLPECAIDADCHNGQRCVGSPSFCVTPG